MRQVYTVTLTQAGWRSILFQQPRSRFMDFWGSQGLSKVYWEIRHHRDSTDGCYQEVATWQGAVDTGVWDRICFTEESTLWNTCTVQPKLWKRVYIANRCIRLGRPISYFSRKLLPQEVRYSTVEKECLAIKIGVEAFQVYLLGQQFVIIIEWPQIARQKLKTG